MAIRVAQQVLQYAAGPTTESDIRVTKVFAQVAVKAVGTPTIGANASNAMFSAGPTVDTSGVVFENTSNVVWATGVVTTGSIGGDQIGTAANVFGWSDVWEYDPIFEIDVNQSIFGGDGQTLTSNYYVASNAMLSDDPIVGYNQTVDVVQYLGFSVRFFAEDVGNTLGISDAHRVAEAVEVSADNYFWTDPANDSSVIRAYNASTSLGITTDVFQFVPADILDSIGFSAVVAAVGDTDRTIGQSGFLNQSLGFTISDNKCREQEYDPQVGEGRSDFKALQVATPVLANTGLVVFSFPVSSPTTTLTMEAPEFQNGETLTFTKIDRVTRGGDRKIYGEGKWASWRRLEFTVKDLCTVDADEIIAFLNTTLGDTIKLVDWEGRGWSGFIVAPETDIVEGVNGWSASFVFEGEPTLDAVQHGSDNVTHNSVDVVHGE